MTPHFLHCIAAGMGVLGAGLAFGALKAEGSTPQLREINGNAYLFGVVLLALAAALGMA